MNSIGSTKKLHLLISSFIVISIFLFSPSPSQAFTEPNFGTAKKLTEGGIASFPSVSGNILTYLEVLDNEAMVGYVVIKNLETSKSITLDIPCFMPSVDGDIVVFSCMEALYMVDTSTLDWDNPGSPTSFLTEDDGINSMTPKIWDHYVLVDNFILDESDGPELTYFLYDLDEPYSVGVNPIVLDTVLTEDSPPLFGVFEDGVIAWGKSPNIKIYNLNDTTPEIQFFNVSTGATALSVNQDYIAWSVSDNDEIHYKTLSNLESDPVEIEEVGMVLGPKLYEDSMTYMVVDIVDKSAELVYYDLSSNQRY